MGGTSGGKLAVVVVNFGSHELLERNLGGAELDRTTTELIIVDNFSSPKNRLAVRALSADRGWVLVEQADNRGFGAGMNAGIAEARRRGCVCFVLLNPDACVGVEVLTELRVHCLSDPLALISPRVETADGIIVFQGAQLQLASGRLRGLRPAFDAVGRPEELALHSQLDGPSREWLGGACLALHETLLDRVGGFDERYFLYWEDVDLSYRVQQAGGSLVVRRDLVAVHEEGGTQGERRGTAKSNTYYYYNCRNRLRFAAKHLSRSELCGWILRTPTESAQILLRGGRRQLVQSPAPLLATLGGTLAGLLLALQSLLRPPAPLRTPAQQGRGLHGSSVVVAHPSPELYGSDRVLLESVSALTAAGAHVVVSVPTPGPLVAEMQARGASVALCRTAVLRKSVLRPRGALAMAAELLRGTGPALRLLRRSRAEVVYVNTITIPAWIVLAKLLGVRVVCHVHEAESSQPALVRRLLALPLLCTGRLIINSEFSKDVLLASCARLARRTTVVPNGVPGPPTTTAARLALDGPVRLLYLGRLSPRKGPQVLVAALGLLRARGVAAELELLGSVFPGYEWFERELHELVDAAGLGALVHFSGFDADVWPHVAAADVVCVPSMADEPFGNTAVEAVLAARPVVVSASSGLVEAVAGYASAQLVEPGRPQLWADAIERVVARWPQYRDDAELDSALARRRHSPQCYQENIAAVVAALLKDSP